MATYHWLTDRPPADSLQCWAPLLHLPRGVHPVRRVVCVTFSPPVVSDDTSVQMLSSLCMWSSSSVWIIAHSVCLPIYLPWGNFPLHMLGWSYSPSSPPFVYRLGCFWLQVMEGRTKNSFNDNKIACSHIPVSVGTQWHQRTGLFPSAYFSILRVLSSFFWTGSPLDPKTTITFPDDMWRCSIKRQEKGLFFKQFFSRAGKIHSSWLPG